MLILSRTHKSNDETKSLWRSCRVPAGDGPKMRMGCVWRNCSGGWITPLKNMKICWDDQKPTIWEKKNVPPLKNMSQLGWFETQWNTKNIPNHQLTYRATPQKPGISFRNPKHLGKVGRCLLLGRWDLANRTLIRKDAMNHNVALYRCSVREKPWLEFTYLKQFRAAPNTQKSRWK